MSKCGQPEHNTPEKPTRSPQPISERLVSINSPQKISQYSPKKETPNYQSKNQNPIRRAPKSPQKHFLFPQDAGPNPPQVAKSKGAPPSMTNSESDMSLKKLASKNPKFQMDSNLSILNISKPQDSITHSTSSLVDRLRDSNSISADKL
jgi:hypothetical protein